jgi:hypothetical protein
VEAELKFDFPTAQRYVEQLAKAGILEEITGKSRNRVFRASRVIAAIDEPIDLPNTMPPRNGQHSSDELSRYTLWQ